MDNLGRHLAIGGGALEWKEEGEEDRRVWTNWKVPSCSQLVAQSSPGHLGDLEREQR